MPSTAHSPTVTDAICGCTSLLRRALTPLRGTLLLGLLALCPATLLALEVTPGGTAITIPAPGKDVVQVTPDLPVLVQYLKPFVAQTNTEWASFVSADAAKTAKRGELPPLARRFSVQTLTALIDKTMTKRDFAESKLQMEATIKQQAQGLPHPDELLRAAAQKSPVDPTLLQDVSVEQVLMLPAHAQGDHFFSFCSLLKVKGKLANGSPATTYRAIATSMLLVNGKLLYLYAFADGSDQEWAKTELRTWTDADLAANPTTNDGPVSAGLVGAVCGGIASLLFVPWFLRRKQRQQQQEKAAATNGQR